MSWMVIFSVQSLVDFSFVWRDSWVGASGMITSSGLITCEKDNIGESWLKHCHWACWRASVCMFPTCCVSTLSVLQRALPGGCASLQPCFWGRCEECWCLLRLLCRNLWAVLLVLVWMQPLALQSSRLWADQCTRPALWQSCGSLGRELLIMVCPNLCCSILSSKSTGWHWSTPAFCSRLTVSKDVKLV